MAINVRFCRTLSRGDRGKDVIAHKRAISRAYPDLYPWWKKGFSPIYGKEFAEAVAKVNKQLTGRTKDIIDNKLHEALEAKHTKKKPTEWAFDAYAQDLAATFCRNFETISKRDQILDAAWYWYEHRYDIHYEQTRPFQLRKPPAVPTEWDCSAFIINCYFAAGSPDPSGRDYGGYGYTGDLWERGQKITFSDIQIADPILYGFTTNPRPGFPYGSPTHVALYVGGGMVLGLGSYPMKYLDYNYRGINSIVRFAV